MQAMVNNDMLSIIFFAILFGFFITKVAKKYNQVLQDFFTSIFEVMMKVTLFVIKFTPLGIFGIVAKTIADQEDLGGLVSSMGIVYANRDTCPSYSCDDYLTRHSEIHWEGQSSKAFQKYDYAPV